MSGTSANRVLNAEQQSLVIKHLGLVHHYVNTKVSSSQKRAFGCENDMVSALYDALMHAAYNFDSTRGVKFSTYAYWSFRCYLDRACQRITGLRSNGRLTLQAGRFEKVEPVCLTYEDKDGYTEDDIRELVKVLQLKPLEMDVFRMVAKGMPLHAAAKQLGIPYRTARWWVQRVRNRARKAKRNGTLPAQFWVFC